MVFTSEHHCGEDVKACVRQQCRENRGAGRGKHFRQHGLRCLIHEEGPFRTWGVLQETPESLPWVGITGSVGKTTTREMIAEALSAGFKGL